MLGSALDLSEGAGGDSFVDTIHVTAGQRYVLYIDNFSANGAAFDLTFQLTGGAALACTPPPQAAFTLSDNTVLVGEPVSFADQSTGSPFNWLWHFPGADQGVSVAQDPEGITWSLPGCYDVSLTATNIAGSDAVIYVCEVDVSVANSIGVDHEGATLLMDHGLLVIDRPGTADALRVAILDPSGRLVHYFEDRGPRVTHDLKDLAPGCYTVAIKATGFSRALRLLVTGL